MILPPPSGGVFLQKKHREMHAFDNVLKSFIKTSQNGANVQACMQAELMKAVLIEISGLMNAVTIEISGLMKAITIEIAAKRDKRRRGGHLM